MVGLIAPPAALAAPPQAAPGANYRPSTPAPLPPGMGALDRITMALSASRAWMTQLDDGDYAATWASADESFRQSLAESAWTDGARRARGTLGVRRSRRLLSTAEKELVAAGPDGHLVLITYESDFEFRSGVVETFTMRQTPQGMWRVTGYQIR